MPILGVIASGISGHLTPPWPDNSYYQIATTTVGAGGSSSITFSSIPATYTHLQIRGIAKTNDTADDRQPIRAIFNADTGNNFSRHLLFGNGSSASYDYGTSTTSRLGASVISNFASYANMFTGFVVDILDYTNTNKPTTTRALGGFTTNNATANNFRQIALGSFAWSNNDAITSIQLQPFSNNFVQYTQFSLYGIKVS
jgi:hypothetical protein